MLQSSRVLALRVPVEFRWLALLSLAGCSPPPPTPSDVQGSDAMDVSMDAPGSDGGTEAGLEGGVVCTNNAACSDGLYCNGEERCAPGENGTDSRGCHPAGSGTAPCPSGERCIETTDRCVSANCDHPSDPDADNDGHDDERCGGDDCDDNAAWNYPGNTEQACDTRDEDCNPCTVAPAGNANDLDRDGVPQQRCSNPFTSSAPPACDATKVRVNASTGVVSGGDCDDAEATIYLGAPESCNSKDDDCDGSTDENAFRLVYPDLDNDRDGDMNAPAEMSLGCVLPPFRSESHTDCNDGDSAVYFGAAERCNGLDDNCNGATDEGLPGMTYYPDSDLDGQGDPRGTIVTACQAPMGYTLDMRDCDDNDNSVFFGNPAELCDGKDNNCSSGTPTDLSEDADGDGHAPLFPANGCTGGFLRDDCNDADNTVYLGAPELCDRKDNNCSSGGMVDVAEDSDSDAYAPIGNSCMGGPLPKTDCNDSSDTVRPGLPESCDGTDTNCSLTSDSADPEALASCGTRPGTTVACTGSPERCVFACAAPNLDCDGNALNGCEVNPQTDPVHCGGCNLRCAVDQACNAGVCTATPNVLAVGKSTQICSVRPDRTVQCWGTNASTLEPLLPAQNVAGLTDVVDLVSGAVENFFVARQSTGQLLTYTPLTASVTTHATLTDVVEVESAGGDWFCARRRNGQVWCGKSSVAFAAVPSLAGVVSLAGGNSVACGLRPAGTVTCTNLSTSATGTVSGLSDAVNVFGSSGSACALRSTGVVLCGISNSSAGSAVAGAPTDLVELRNDNISGHSCARAQSGSVLCWGANYLGQLGSGSTTAETNPRVVSGVSGAVGIAIGTGFSCAQSGDGSVRCWGSNTQAQLGGAISPPWYATPQTVPGFGGIDKIYLGRTMGCGIDGATSGLLYCHGLYPGNGGSASATPVAVPTITDAAEVAFAEAGPTVCVRRSNRSVSCWGYGGDGEFGTGSIPSPSEALSPVSSQITTADELAGSYDAFFARLSTGAVVSWGRDAAQELGDGNASVVNRPGPLAVAGSFPTPVSLAGSFGGCAASSSGQAWCWGPAWEYRNSSYWNPSTVATFATGLGEIQNNYSNLCARHEGSRTIQCMGYNNFGQLGNGSTSAIPVTTPVTVSGISNAAELSMGTDFACARLTDGTVKCWGHNQFGQLGDGTYLTRTSPVTVTGLTNVVSISSYRETTCAARGTGEVVCWGQNGSNQFGNNAGPSRSLVPVMVPGLGGGVVVSDRLILNEVDYDNPGAGTDSAEFVELYNAGTSSVNLSNYAIVLVNGSDGSSYSSTTLSGTLAPGAYAVVGPSTLSFPGGTLNLPISGVAIQNGPPDGVALVNVAAGMVVDALSYEGSITTANVTGVVGTVNLVEGPTATAAVDNAAPGSLCRIPNGSDSNVASTDWVLCTAATPGAANTP